MGLIINGVRVAGVGANGRDGVGVIPGGKSGQILSKRSDADHDTIWTDLPSIDATLSQEGQAADANAVGNQINTINNIISEGDESTLSSAKNYTDEQVANLVNSAPETLDTLGELATAFNENKEVVDALNEAIVLKANKSYVDESLNTKANVEEPRFSGSMGMNHTGELGWTSVSLGFANEASGMYCFAEGMGNKATGDASHAEGTGTTASRDAAHAEGYGTLASNVGSHAEGANTKATGYGSHAEGSSTIASIEGQHVEGKYNIDDTTAIHIVGNGTSDTKRSNAHTLGLDGEAWFSGDVYTGSTSGTHKDDGSKKLATEDYVNTQISGIEIPSTENMLLKTEQVLTDEELTQVRSNLKFIGKGVEGQTFNINGQDIVASANAEIFGDYENNKCTGQWSIVEGSTNIATGRACHVEGAQNQALNDGCHVEGVSCIASGYWSHAEGEMTRVTSYASHAEGSYTKMPDGTTRYGTASGYASHIEGGGCHAEASCSHSEGLATTTKGNYSHSEGKYTIASSPAQHVQGAGNIEDADSVYLHIVGNGDFGAASNAHTLDWEGNAWFSGNVYIGSTSGVNKDEGSKKLATEEYVDNNSITLETIDEICI